MSKKRKHRRSDSPDAILVRITAHDSWVIARALEGFAAKIETIEALGALAPVLGIDRGTVGGHTVECVAETMMHFAAAIEAQVPERWHAELEDGEA